MLQLKQMLDETKALDPPHLNSKDKVRQIMEVVGDHIRQEESTMFAAIRDNMSSDQSEQLATRSNQLKARCKTKWLGSVNKCKVNCS